MIRRKKDSFSEIHFLIWILLLDLKNKLSWRHGFNLCVFCVCGIISKMIMDGLSGCSEENKIYILHVCVSASIKGSFLWAMMRKNCEFPCDRYMQPIRPIIMGFYRGQHRLNVDKKWIKLDSRHIFQSLQRIEKKSFYGLTLALIKMNGRISRFCSDIKKLKWFLPFLSWAFVYKIDWIIRRSLDFC